VKRKGGRGAVAHMQGAVLLRGNDRGREAGRRRLGGEGRRP